MGAIEVTPFTLWPVYFDHFTGRFYHQRATATTSPWALMKLEIRKTLSSGEEQRVCLSCLDQAEFFYNAQITATNPAAKSLLIYYYAMNLVKAYLIARDPPARHRP